MSSKKALCRRCRWSSDETLVFAQVLADPENAFGHFLEMLALKKCANKEMFENIRTEFLIKNKKTFSIQKWQLHAYPRL